MKTFLVSTLLFVSGSAIATVAPANSSLAKLIGVYTSDGHRFIIYRNGNTLGLKTDAELTKAEDCRTQLGRVINQDSDDGFAEVTFLLGKGTCSGVDGPVVLHYNRALTGVDVYLIDVYLYGGTSYTRGESRRWSLTKIR